VSKEEEDDSKQWVKTVLSHSNYQNSVVAL